MSGKRISSKTLQRRLNEVGVKDRRPTKNPLLTNKIKKIRLSRPENLKKWLVNDWAHVIYSDESNFNLFEPDGNKLVDDEKDSESS